MKVAAICVCLIFLSYHCLFLFHLQKWRSSLHFLLATTFKSLIWSHLALMHMLVNSFGTTLFSLLCKGGFWELHFLPQFFLTWIYFIHINESNTASNILGCLNLNCRYQVNIWTSSVEEGSFFGLLRIN